MHSHNIISYHIIYNIISYTILHYYIIIVAIKNIIRLLLVTTNLHISLEAVEWRLVQVTFEYLG